VEILDVVNAALVATNFAPISVIEETNPTAARIVGILQGTLGLTGVKGEILRRGWPFNSERCELVADSGGQITVPGEYLVFQPERRERFQVVGRKIRDLQTRSFTIDAGDQPVAGLAILDIDFEDVPDAVAAWMAAETSYRFARSMFHGSPLIGELRHAVTAPRREAINAYPVELPMPHSAERQAARYGSTVRAAGFGAEQ